MPKYQRLRGATASAYSERAPVAQRTDTLSVYVALPRVPPTSIT